MEIGFALMKGEKIIKFEKGVNLDVRDIAKVLMKTNYDWALFHTRLASVGTRCDKNCHPFKRGDTILAMNGTERTVGFLSETMDITDTEAILETMSKYNLGLAALRKFSSIFMGFFKGKPFVVADNTYSIKVLNNKDTSALVFASSFPARFKNNIYEATKHFCWNGDKLPNVFKKYKRKYYKPIFFDDYVYHNDLYDQCYIEALEKQGGNGNAV